MTGSALTPKKADLSSQPTSRTDKAEGSIDTPGLRPRLLSLESPEFLQNATTLTDYHGAPELPSEAERARAVCGIVKNAHKKHEQFDDITKLVRVLSCVISPVFD